MGIPLFFKSVTRKYPSIIDSGKPNCARLFLDLNCCIHQSTNNIIQMNQSMLKETIERDIVLHTIDYIQKIVNYTNPTELLYIAIDGIPPHSKIVQQRKRRFVSAWRESLINAKKKDLNVSYAEWDRNAITPGTNFMDYLSKSLHSYFDNSTKFGIKVILSDSNEPGEGEAKILDYIKSTPIPTADSSDIIYGLDADLIMLSLLTSRNNIYLLREPVHFDMKVPKPFLLLNIQLLRCYIAVECGVDEPSSEGVRIENGNYDENLVWDYVVLCFMIGNDFLPPLSFLKIKFNGIEMLIQNYRKVREELNQTLITCKNLPNGSRLFNLNYLFLLKLINLLKGIEDECMCEVDDNYYSMSPPPYIGKKSPIERIGAEIDSYPIINKFPRKINPQKTGWRLNYYNYLFNMTEIQDINDICLNYLEGLEWTMNYYFNSCLSRCWYYKYNYSPSLLDLYNFLLINLQDTETFLRDSIEKNFPPIQYDTDLQLLLVLPPSSKELLKPKLRSIMNDISLGCLHYYPNKFKISTYLKIYLWEASPLLPPIDVEKLNKVKTELLKT
jgi:5'-3' exonuclease